jgi:pimeloyl-ACP methyl ester carboxylesterase
MKKSFICLALAASFAVGAQDLPRRPLLGTQLVKVDEDTKRVMDLPEMKGALIKSIIPHSTAEKAGFKTGDVVLKLNGHEINSPAEAVELVANSVSGTSFTYELIRDKKVITGNTVLEPMPVEKYPGIEMVYSSVKTINGLQRLIISKPTDSKKHPAIIFIGGIGCYSLDFPLEPERSEVLLLNHLTKQGYVCIRAEKPGVGDNRKCTPCAEVSFDNEISGYVSAAQAIKKYDYIDSSSVYIIGHSMGGVMAPVVAQQTNVKGIIAYGTIGSNFIEYLAKSRRTLAKAYNMSPEETEIYIKDWCECSVHYFVDGMSTKEVANKKPDCERYLSVFDYRSSAYNKQLYDLNIAAAWKDYKGKALLIWGESDFVSTKDDHQIIVNNINFYHKGNASYLGIPSTSHGMGIASSMQEAINATNEKYNPEVGLKISQWLKRTG